MTIKKAIEILKKYQQWRVGEKIDIAYSGQQISEAINTILKHHDNL